FIAGDVTLPFLTLRDTVSQDKRRELENLLQSEIDRDSLTKIREMFINSGAADLTRKTALSYVDHAKQRLVQLENSDYKRSLNYLADYVTQ
ncbi:MAG: hypothetical protein ACYSTF_10770, partial [Planctomycetota bacterium]